MIRLFVIRMSVTFEKIESEQEVDGGSSGSTDRKRRYEQGAGCEEAD
jgi:hypothetical protein